MTDFILFRFMIEYGKDKNNHKNIFLCLNPSFLNVNMTKYGIITDFSIVIFKYYSFYHLYFLIIS